MGKYAKQTTVSAEKSRAEIETILIRYGASKFGYMMDSAVAMIGFEANARRLRFVLPLPAPDHRKRDQEIRQRWRALALAIKAKLEAVTVGISTFEDEFLPYTVLPDGKTVSEWIQPQLNAAFKSGKMPPLLTAGTP